MTTAVHPYAQVLGARDPLTVLAETEQRIPALAQALGPEGLQRRYAPGKWTATEVIAHLADCEIAFGFRVRQMLAEPNLGIQTFDQDVWARHYGQMDADQAVRAFAALRAWNLALFRRLDRKDLDQTANHPERGPEKVETVLRIIAGHTLNHVAQLESIAAGRPA